MTQICGVDSFCCATLWDGICVSEVRTVCNSLKCPEAQGSCSHSLCTAYPTGSPLSNGCDSIAANCVSTICGLDSWCCNTGWDSICVSEVTSYCGKNCN